MVDEDFETFRSIYPKRQGSDPGRPAKAAWDKAIRRGATAQEIIDGARYFADTNRRIAADDRRFIPRASTFLNEDRFRDRNGPITSRRGGSILDALDAIPAGYEAPPVP